MLPLTPLVLGALRSVSDGVGWGCLDKSLSQNGVEMEHALVMMWNLMFAFCPAGKRGFGLVIFFFFFRYIYIFFFRSFFGMDASGGTKGRGLKNARPG